MPEEKRSIQANVWRGRTSGAKFYDLLRLNDTVGASAAEINPTFVTLAHAPVFLLIV